jgi:hypothetical protein
MPLLDALGLKLKQFSEPTTPTDDGPSELFRSDTFAQPARAFADSAPSSRQNASVAPIEIAGPSSAARSPEHSDNDRKIRQIIEILDADKNLPPAAPRSEPVHVTGSAGIPYDSNFRPNQQEFRPDAAISRPNPQAVQSQMQDDTVSRLSEPLTRRFWEQNRNLLFRQRGRTGIGAALDELKAAYDQFDYRNTALKDLTPEAEARVWAERDKAENVYKAANKVAKLAEKARSTLFLRDSDKNVLDTIIAEAKGVAGGADPQKIVQEMYQEVERKNKAYRITQDSVLKNVPVHVNRSRRLLQSAASWDDWSRMGVKEAVRHITQLVGNVPKLRKAGFKLSVDPDRCDKYLKLLAPFGNQERPMQDFAEAKTLLAAVLEDMLDYPITGDPERRNFVDMSDGDDMSDDEPKSLIGKSFLNLDTSDDDMSDEQANGRG